MNVTLGLAAGAAGTLTLGGADALERRALGARAVYAPARIAQRLLGAEPAQAARWGRLLRWTYGPAWALAYAAVRGRPRRFRPDAAAGLAAAITALERRALPAVGATPLLAAWSRAERLLLPVHALVFALATEGALRVLGRPRR